MDKKNDPFKKQQAASQEAAEVTTDTSVNFPEAPKLLDQLAAEVMTIELKAPFQLSEPKAPEPKIDVSKFSKEEAQAYIAKQFAAKIPVFVIALDTGEHPRSGQWKVLGQKFKLEKAELYSHRWMKLT